MSESSRVVERTYLGADPADDAGRVVHLGDQHAVPARRRASTTPRPSRPMRSSRSARSSSRSRPASSPTRAVGASRSCWARRPCSSPRSCTCVMWQVRAPFVGWAVSSILLGLGFTFFSGATEAWLVDALDATGFTGHLEQVFGRAQTVGGAAMLVGSVLGRGHRPGHQPRVSRTSLRAAMLGVTVVVALRFMHDLGFTPARDASPGDGRPDGGPRRDRRRLPQSAGPLADAGRAVHGGHRDLRLLRDAAVPAAAVRRHDRLRDRRPRGGARRRRADRRWARRARASGGSSDGGPTR